MWFDMATILIRAPERIHIHRTSQLESFLSSNRLHGMREDISLATQQMISTLRMLTFHPFPIGIVKEYMGTRSARLLDLAKKTG